MAAGFLGDTVTLSVYDPVYHPNYPQDGLQVSGTETVFSGIEFPDVAGLPQYGRHGATPAVVEITQNDIEISNASEGGRIPRGIFDGYVLQFGGKPNDVIKNVQVIDTNIEGLNPNSILFNKTSVLINGAGTVQPLSEPTFIDLHVTFAHKAKRAVHDQARTLIMGED